MPAKRSLFALLTAAANLNRFCAAQCQLEPRTQPEMASGYQSGLVMNGLLAPRQLVFDTQGALLIVEQGGGGVRHVQLTDSGGINVCVSSQKQLISDRSLNHGIALSADGRTLYVSSPTTVYSYSYDPISATAGSPQSIIDILSQSGGHQTRTLLIPRNNPTTLLVTVGSEGNLDRGATQPASGRSMIRAFDLRSLGRSISVPFSSGALFGWGLRNSVGLGENPITGEVWSVDNGLDDMVRNGLNIHNDNPGEELNFHGRTNDTASGFYGQNYGYPNCHAVWSINGLSGSQTGDQVIQGNPSTLVTDQYCDTYTVAPRLTLAPHSAPLDVEFAPNGRSAFIAFHGSWNRNPADGYRLSRVDFGVNGQPLHPANGMAAEFRVMQNRDVKACPRGCFRPVGLAWDPWVPDRLFMTSDQTGELFVVTVPAWGSYAYIGRPSHDGQK